MTENNNNTSFNEVSDSVKEYINLKIDKYKLKGVENFSILTNKMIFILIATMLGGVILQLLGLATSFFVGQLVGNIALGFLIVAVFFIILLAIVYLNKDKLFIDKLVQLYIKMFFDNKK